MKMKPLTYEQVLQRAIDYDAVMSKKGKSRRSFTLEQMAREIYQAQYPNHISSPLLAESSVRYWKNALKMEHTLRRTYAIDGFIVPEKETKRLSKKEIERRLTKLKASKKKDNHRRYTTEDIVEAIYGSQRGTIPKEMPLGTLRYWMHQIGMGTKGMTRLFKLAKERADLENSELVSRSPTIRTVNAIFSRPPMQRRYVGY
jgi:hypothetical protein